MELFSVFWLQNISLEFPKYYLLLEIPFKNELQSCHHPYSCKHRKHSPSHYQTDHYVTNSSFLLFQNYSLELELLKMKNSQSLPIPTCYCMQNWKGKSIPWCQQQEKWHYWGFLVTVEKKPIFNNSSIAMKKKLKPKTLIEERNTRFPLEGGLIEVREEPLKLNLVVWLPLGFGEALEVEGCCRRREEAEGLKWPGDGGGRGGEGCLFWWVMSCWKGEWVVASGSD